MMTYLEQTIRRSVIDGPWFIISTPSYLRWNFVLLHYITLYAKFQIFSNGDYSVLSKQYASNYLFANRLTHNLFSNVVKTKQYQI